MAGQHVAKADEEIAGVTEVVAQRIGLIGDDHNSQEDGSDLPDEVFEAFRDVDLILHLGHMGVRERLARGVLDRLGKVAPVLAVRDFYTDESGSAVLSPSDGHRVAGVTRIVKIGHLRIGLIHNLAKGPGPEIPAAPGGIPELDDKTLGETLPKKFGGSVDIVAFASTHRAVAMCAHGVLLVNPGSPTYPKGPGRVPGQRMLGTVGILTLRDRVAAFELIDLQVLSPGVAASA